MTLLVLTLYHLIVAAPENRAHNFHVSYGKMAVEGNSIYLSLRFFKDDLETALCKSSARDDLKLAATPQCDSIYLRYFAEKFEITCDGRRLRAELLSSGEDGDMWWYKLNFSDSKTLHAVTIKNTLLFELFDDQKNIVQVMHFPSEQQQSFYFIRGAERYTASF
ncbi:MAG: hypothetical protein HY22_02670 [[Candidatus Thermochlorobacteriaceae] bacterium GBChlB]|jgi:hypothetical protein|nr:MAG: hypothetical protein HY22_02670 [[Candidatus Thermochlorobacteriaceae] bacterium GBChlB]